VPATTSEQRDSESATSGKAGGLTKVERLKAAQPCGRTFHRFGSKKPLQLCRSHCQDFSMPHLLKRLPSAHQICAAPARRCDLPFPLFPIFPEPSNFGSLSGRAGGFPVGL